VPLVRRILTGLAAAGVTRTVLNLHHLPETITAAVGDGSDLGVEVRYSWENPVLGSAGGPRRALPLLDTDRFLIVNGDTLTDLSLERLVAEHASSGSLVTLAVIPNPAPERYGGVLVNASGDITGFVRRGSPGPSWHFVGLQVAEAAAFARLPPDEPAESVSGLYATLLRESPGSIHAFRADGVFYDIGTAADYLDTSLAFAAREGRENQLVGPGCRVSPDARLARSVLWNDVTVGDHAELIDCVVADGAKIPAEARYQGCAIVKADGREARPGEERVGDLLLARIPARRPSKG